MKDDLTIDYISEITGSGKTEKVINQIANNNEYYIIVAPNRLLCDEIALRFFMLDSDDDVVNIHQRTVEKPSKEFRQYLKTKEKRIIVTTHASFMMGLKYQDDISSWHLVLDEEMPMFKEHEINVTAYSKQIIEDTIDFVDYDENFYMVNAKNTLLWMNINSNVVNDSFLKTRDYKELVDYTMNKKYITLVAKDMLEKFDNVELDSTGKKFSKLYCISLMNTEVLKKFKSITMICSFFEKTITYKLLEQLGCKLNKLDYGLTHKTHEDSDRITIHYFFETNWSTHLRKKKATKYKTLEMLVYERIKSLIGNKDFLYNANVSFRSNVSKGTLAVSTHGINKYISYTELVFMPSLNATSAVVKVLSKFGLKRKEIDFARNVLTAYQFVSRGAIRDRNNKEKINIYVMDRRTAVFLKSIFPDAVLEFHDMEPKKSYEKKEKIPNNVKSFMSRVKKRIENGEHVRDKTLEKYQDYMEKYYTPE